jgi:hypothetical protein
VTVGGRHMPGQLCVPLPLAPPGAWLPGAGVVVDLVGVVALGVLGVLGVLVLAALAIAAPPPASTPVTASAVNLGLRRRMCDHLLCLD